MAGAVELPEELKKQIKEHIRRLVEKAKVGKRVTPKEIVELALYNRLYKAKLESMIPWTYLVLHGRAKEYPGAQVKHDATMTMLNTHEAALDIGDSPFSNKKLEGFDW